MHNDAKITLDINEMLGLALVTNETLTCLRYEPLADAHHINERFISAIYIRQCHTAANTKSMGLIAHDRGVPRDGWKRLEQLNCPRD